MNRLRAFRAIEGINQEQLGEILDLSVPMISGIESGRRTFGGDLMAIGYRPDRFDLPPMSPPLHRHKASTPAAAKKRAHELLRLGGEVFAELRSRTPRAPDPAFDRLPAPVSADAIEDLSIELRAVMQHEDTGPIRNLTAAAERAGVCIIPVRGLDGIDGLSSWVDGTPVIAVDPTVPGDRFRFTLAHEAGHLLFHSVAGEHTEAEANRFASALLVPPADFDAALPDRPNLSDFVQMKKTWGMSVAALVYRAHETGRIGDDRYRALQIQMSKWRRREPGGFEPVHGQLLQKLVEAHGGAEQVAGSVGVNQRHLRDLLNWSHLQVAYS